MSSSIVSPQKKAEKAHISPASQVTPEQMEIYRAAARRRAQQGLSPEAEARRQRALAAARRAAAVLKEEFGATRVVVFGSAAHGHWFTETSDIDLAVSGVAWSDFFRAWNQIETTTSDFGVDLVDIEDAVAGVQRSIEKHGIEL